MYNVTVAYVSNNGEFFAFHIQHATTEKLQTALDNADIYALEHILEQHRAVGLNQFSVYAKQNELVDFLAKWKLKY